MIVEIDFEPIGRRISIEAGVTLLDAARQAGVALSADCGGNGTCGRCKVRLMSGILTPPTANEIKRLGQDMVKRGWRFACQAKAESDIKVQVPLESMRGAQRLQLGGLQPEVEIEPIHEAVPVALDPPTLQDATADMTRLMQALRKQTGRANLHYDIIVGREVPGALRSDHWQGTAWIRGDEVCAVTEPHAAPLGFAVDLGTTKIASYLVDLSTGETLASAGVMNPQISYGEDLMSRIAYANQGEQHAAELSYVVVDALNKLLAELCAQVKRSPRDVLEMVVGANTAMHHLFLCLPVEPLGSAPYVAAVGEAWDVKARELGLGIAPGAYVHLLPNIAGFVGADHVAMILATEAYKVQGKVIGLDIGTNTEIVLSYDGKMASCSCASGPAFEGAHITQGMRATTGAIERIVWTDDGFKITTIDDAPPVGICGSGILDAVAVIYRAGIMGENGRFIKDHPLVSNGEHGLQVELVPASESGHGKAIVVTQRDVGEIQLAKGAIRAGLESLLAYAELDYGDLDAIVIAGAFGTFVDVESAIIIGMFPPLDRRQFRQVGNAAGVGAKLALISRSQRAIASQIGHNVHYVELMSQPNFTMIFADAMMFPALELLENGVSGG